MSFENSKVTSFKNDSVEQTNKSYGTKRPQSAQISARKSRTTLIPSQDDYQQNLPSKQEDPNQSKKNQSRNSQRKLVPTQNIKETINQLREQPQDQDPLQDQKNRTIWRAFGSYVAKQLINGKGVIVPGFGLFSFSATDVCLSGTTNPGKRDKQFREPVFIISKDFGANFQSGICSQNDTLRPLQLKGVSGVIPQVKINFVEVSSLSGLSKEACKDSCDQIFKYLSTKARKGEQLSVEIPMIGRFLIRLKVAAVNFFNDLVQQTRGMTAKTFTVGNIFGNSNATHNMSMGVTRNSLGGAIKVNNDAESWLMANLGIDVNNMPAVRPQSAQIQGMGRRSASVQNLNKSALSESRLSLSTSQNQRVQSQSQHSRPRSAAQSYHKTEMASHMSILPPSDRFTLVAAAKKIFKNRQAISTAALQLNRNLRDVLTSGQILKIFREANINIDLITIKQLLNELGFQFNGPATSLTQFLTATKALLHGQRQFEGQFMRQSDTASNFSHLTGLSGRQGLPNRIPAEIQKTINTIRDIFYTCQRTLFDLFKLGMSGQTVDKDGFQRIVIEASGGVVKAEVADSVFSAIIRQENKLTFEVFEKIFRSEVPTSIEMETKVIRAVREWQFRNNLSAEMAFDSFCRVVGNYSDKTLTRAQFHRALITLEVGISAAQTDALFALLVSEATGKLDVNMWLSRIFEDGDNPIQMVREIVAEHKLTQEDMLYQMKLKAWDNPLTFQQLTTAIRNLDQSMSDIQIRSMFVSLKDSNGLVPVMTLIQNLTGKPFQTVDFKLKIQKQIYADIYPDKEEKLLFACQLYDKENDGFIRRQDLVTALKQSVSIPAQDLESFVRLLEADALGRLSYIQFIEQLTKQVNKNHNPFRSIVNRLAYFLKHNNVTAGDLVKRVVDKNSDSNTAGISITYFAEFLKQKVDKKADVRDLKLFSGLMDIDKDGYVSENDMTTCIKNLQNTAFWKPASSLKPQKVTGYIPVEAKLSQEKAYEIIDQITEQMARQKITYKDLFSKFDSDKDNMVSLAEFVRGITSVITIALPFAEQLYGLMDKRGIGLINYSQFLEVLKQRKTEKPEVTDNFNWEYQTIQKITQWILQQKITTEEAFKCFDKDFDGLISKEDLKNSLVTLLEIPRVQIVDAKIDRLFRLLDTFKSGVVQLCDFQRLQKRQNEQTSQGNVDTFDWKFSAIQQIGLILSKKYSSLAESFAFASKDTQKVNFENFVNVTTKENLLNGFNLTSQLMAELFSELDPHKKGYISFNDWKNAFGVFNYSDQQLIELKASIASAFVNHDSAFNFFLTFGSQKNTLNEATFTKAINSITSERFKPEEIKTLWSKLSKQNSMDIYDFREVFGTLNFKGTQTVTSLKTVFSNPKSKTTNSSMARTTIKTANSASDKWEQNIVEKLRGIIKTSSKSIQDIFNEFDQDGNGVITQVEFRNAIRKLNLGLSSKEIDQLMMRIDANSDGMIDYIEFSNKFCTNQFEDILVERGKEKLAKLKELMILHMTSTMDAFRYFDTQKNGTLAFSEFNQLVISCYEVAKLKPPTFPVIKDLFDLIDVRRDGELDINEWSQTFGRVTEGGNSISLKPTALSMWETTKEFRDIGTLLGKSRKHLIEKFKSAVGPESQKTIFNLAQGKVALDDWIYQNFKGSITDAQLKCLFAPAQVPLESQNELRYDYMRLLDLYKARYQGPQK